jgi:hypothetical protein
VVVDLSGWREGREEGEEGGEEWECGISEGEEEEDRGAGKALVLVYWVFGGCGRELCVIFKDDLPNSMIVGVSTREVVGKKIRRTSLCGLRRISLMRLVSRHVGGFVL